jgi:Viral BACON domain
MNSQAFPRHFSLTFLLILFLLASCSGGGSSTPLPIPNGAMETETKQLDFLAIKEVHDIVRKTINVRVTSNEVALVAVGTPTGTPVPAWLSWQVNFTGDGFTVDVSAFTQSIAPGEYTTTLRLLTGRKDESVVGYIDIPVKFVYSKQIFGRGGIEEITLDYINGAPMALPSTQFELIGTGLSWTAKFNAPWLTLDQVSGIAPAQVKIGLAPADLAPGQYTTTITFTATDGSRPFELKVIFNNRAPTLNVTSQVAVGMVQGSVPAIYPLYVQSNGSPLNWTATSDQPWLILNASSGTAYNPYIKSTMIDYRVDTAGKVAGTYTATMRITDQNGGAHAVLFTLTIVNSQLDINANAPFVFDYAIDGPLPPSKYLYISTNGSPLGWTAVADQSWIKLDRSAGTAPEQIFLAVDPTGLVAGTYTGKINIKDTLNGATVSLNVELQVKKAAIELVDYFNPNDISLYGTNGSDLLLQPRPYSIRMNNGKPATWTAKTNSTWLRIVKSTGTAPGELLLYVDAATPKLAGGNYLTTIDITADYNGTSLATTAKVNLSLGVATLDIFTTEIELGGPGGHNPASVPVSLSSNNNKSIDWTLTPSANWIKPDITSGPSGWFDPNTGQYVAAARGLNIGLDAKGLVRGKYQGELVFTAAVNGDNIERKIPVSLQVDSHRLLASQNGIALTKTPSLSRLTRTLKVTENFGGKVNWSATSDQPWLTVTASGVSPGDLVISANPAGITPDSLQFATVTLSSSDPSIENTEQIRVGLWVGSSAPTTTLKIPAAFTEVKADPVRPYIYAHNGGPDITIFHAYTGAEVAKLSNIAPRIGDMAVNGDGTRLFVANKSEPQIIPIDLNNMKMLASWPLRDGQLRPYVSITAARPNGIATLAVNDGNLYSENGIVLNAYQLAWTGGQLKVAKNLPVLFRLPVQEGGFTFLSGARVFLDYSVATNSMPISPNGANGTYLSMDFNVKGFGVSEDASRLFLSIDQISDFRYFNGSSAKFEGVLPGAGSPNNVVIGFDGRVYGGSENPTGDKDLWVYDAAGFAVTSLRITSAGKSMLPRQLIQSGDGLLLIAPTDDPALQIIPITF